jgi:ORF6N domain.
MEKTDVWVLKPEAVQSKIFTIRGVQVMIDRDLAELYGVETKALNQAVKRNPERFPKHYCFQLTNLERDEVVTNCDHLSNLRFSYQMPYAFTEFGVSMLASVLRGETAAKISIQIIDSFVSMRRFLYENAAIFQRLDTLERKQLETDGKHLRPIPIL